MILRLLSYLFLCFLFCNLISCKHDKLVNDNIAYLGGEIINPVSKYVVLYKNNALIDSIFLDTDNRFLYKITELNSGLYKFLHGNEIQFALIQPNDSLLFRLNTLEFDESLVYTGIGAKENNFLINMYLEREKIRKNILKHSQLSPDVFINYIDSIKGCSAQYFRKLYREIQYFGTF